MYDMMAACAIGRVALAGVIETRECSLRGETVPGQAGRCAIGFGFP
ncbi:hypothetical protein [Burkholderia sp. Bp8998]|nr:hypothetical protein [Burkholderia sp. Bp8998]